MKKERFKLSSSGKVAAWMALAFVTLNSAAAGIVADGGPDGPGFAGKRNGYCQYYNAKQ